MKRWKFSLTWWTLIFPIGIMLFVEWANTADVNTNALIALSLGMDSPAFRVLATAFTLLLVIAWLILAPLTLFNIRRLLKLPERRKTSH